MLPLLLLGCHFCLASQSKYRVVGEMAMYNDYYKLGSMLDYLLII